MKGKRSESQFESDLPRWRRVRRSRLAAPAVGLAAAVVLSGGAADRLSVSRGAEAQDIAAYVKPAELAFNGERPPDVELFYWADSVANEYWNQLGRGRSDCEDGLSVIFTDHFDGYDNPNRQPEAAIKCSLRDLWINQAPVLSKNPWKLAKVLTHEYGHARGLRHSHDRESIMYAKRDKQNRGTFANPEDGGVPPTGATKDSLRRLFQDRVQGFSGSESR